MNQISKVLNIYHQGYFNIWKLVNRLALFLSSICVSAVKTQLKTGKLELKVSFSWLSSIHIAQLENSDWLFYYWFISTKFYLHPTSMNGTILIRDCCDYITYKITFFYQYIKTSFRCVVIAAEIHTEREREGETMR